ncbi:unnamed protein product [Musa hybrid cultivar]
MGLSNHLHGVSGDSLPLLILAAAAASLVHLRSVLLRLLPLSASAADPEPSVGSGLVVLADHLLSDRAFPFYYPEERGVGRWPACAVCLCGLADGDRVRRLPCSHVFHRDCLNVWLLHQLNLSCPLCRSQLAEPDIRAAAERRIGAQLVHRNYDG